MFSLFTQFDYQNYAQAWSGVSQPLLNTVIVAAGSILIGVTAAALGAYAFSQLRFRGKELLLLAYIALLLIPWTLTLIPLFLTFQKLGLFNTWWALILPYAASAQPLLVLIFRGFFAGSSGSTPSGRAGITARRPSCWPSWCCAWPTAASSGSLPTRRGGPPSPPSGTPTC